MGHGRRKDRRRAGVACLVAAAISMATRADADEAVALTRGPYLQRGSPTGIVVRYRTDVPTSGRVLYGPSPAALSSSVMEPAVTLEHAVELEGLSPGTRYYYAVESATKILAGGDAQHYFDTAPPPGSFEPVRIWALGDSGTGTDSARDVRDAFAALDGGGHADVWLMLGDNAYEEGTDEEYQDALFEMYPEMLRRSVLWPTLGNHDGLSSESATESGPYYAIFDLPRASEAGGLASGTEAYYAFDYANIHFVVLNSYDVDRDPGSPMLTWLEQDLEGTNQDWTLAYWHHPPYSKGSHDSDDEDRLIEMRENVLPILEAHGVDVVLSGHSHSYERSVLLDGHYGSSDTFGPDHIVDGGDGREDGDGAYHKPALGPSPHAGTVYVVAGSSGHTSDGDLDHPVMIESLDELGSLVIDVSGNRLDLRFIDERAAVRDHFTMRKGVSCPNDPAQDVDGDTHCGDVDNCPLAANPGQLDTDGDGPGNACDNCPLAPNPAQLDFDSDLLGDACESGARLADANHSARVDGFDLVLLAQAFGAACEGAAYDAAVDLSRDCLVDGEDLALLAKVFGETVP